MSGTGYLIFAVHEATDVEYDIDVTVSFSASSHHAHNDENGGTECKWRLSLKRRPHTGVRGKQPRLVQSNRLLHYRYSTLK